MTSFKNNFSTLRLLANQNITFWDEKSELSFEMIPLKVEDIFFDNDINWFIGVLEKDISELQKNIDGIIVKSHYDFITLILTMPENDNNITKLKKTIQNSFDKIVPGVFFKNKTFKINDDYFTKQMFDEVVEILFKILKKEKITIKDTDDEFTKREKEAQIRAQKIRSQGKKINNDDKKSNIEELFAAILYEFPQYKLEDIFKLNIYTFYYLFGYVGKIANYEVSQIAAGNGLTKKHKYFIEK